MEWARRAEDTRLQAAVQLRLADTLERLGDPVAARLHRGAAERILGEEPRTASRSPSRGRKGGREEEGKGWKQGGGQERRRNP